MKTEKNILEDFYEFCEGRVAFTLNDGTHYEGYMFQILDNTFTFFLGGPLASDEPVEIKISDVELNSLCFYNESEHKWKTAVWRDEISKWEIKDYIF